MCLLKETFIILAQRHTSCVSIISYFHIADFNLCHPPPPPTPLTNRPEICNAFFSDGEEHKNNACSGHDKHYTQTSVRLPRTMVLDVSGLVTSKSS